jgi:hypothetical protein
MTVWRHPAWHVPPGQVGVRGCVAAGSVVVLLATAAVGPVPAWLAVAVGALTLVVLVLPGSPLGLALVAALTLPWVLQPAGAVTSPWVLLAAAGLVAVHVALHLASQGPAVMRPDPAQVRLWLRRAAALWCAPALLWLAARWLQGTTTPAAVFVLALVLLATTLVWIGERMAQGPSA